eukprot:8464374-Pyramimonas_sp.AAC.1
MGSEMMPNPGVRPAILYDFVLASRPNPASAPQPVYLRMGPSAETEPKGWASGGQLEPRVR